MLESRCVIGAFWRVVLRVVFVMNAFEFSSADNLVVEEPSGHSYKTPFLGVVFLCVILLLAISVLGFFLYKRKYGTQDIIGMCKF